MLAVAIAGPSEFGCIEIYGQHVRLWFSFYPPLMTVLRARLQTEINKLFQSRRYSWIPPGIYRVYTDHCHLPLAYALLYGHIYQPPLSIAINFSFLLLIFLLFSFFFFTCLRRYMIIVRHTDSRLDRWIATRVTGRHVPDSQHCRIYSPRGCK